MSHTNTQRHNSRARFFQGLIKLAEKDSSIILLTNDVGYSFVEKFAQLYPKQFLNCGIMEQTITGIAAGLALAGKKPYYYSMIPFVIMRNYEQLRNDILLQGLNVKLVAVQGGESYKFLGESHNMVCDDEDIKLLTHLPVDIYIPGEEGDVVEKTVEATYNIQKPAYIRL